MPSLPWQLLGAAPLGKLQLEKARSKLSVFFQLEEFLKPSKQFTVKNEENCKNLYLTLQYIVFQFLTLEISFGPKFIHFEGKLRRCFSELDFLKPGD